MNRLSTSRGFYTKSEGFHLKCPYCCSDAFYRYGKIRTGKQRFLCLLCGKQFTLGARKSEIKNKPVCPTCGKIMHLYKREEKAIRFRCSNYPACRSYIKILSKEP